MVTGSVRKTDVGLMRSIALVTSLTVFTKKPMVLACWRAISDPFVSDESEALSHY